MSSEPTIDEIIATLNHSDAPTLILEGKDDYVAFEQLERENVAWGFTVLPIKGRRRVIQLIERRTEINNPCIFYLMDQDEWCFLGIPDSFRLDFVAFTNGASIENDLITDGNPMQLMSIDEQQEFWTTLEAFMEIFTRLVFNHVNRVPDHSYASSLRLFVTEDLQKLPEWDEFCHRCRDAMPEPEGLERIAFIRGKTLLELVTMILSHKERRSKYSKANVLEMGARARGNNLRRLESMIIDFFERTGRMTIDDA
ncbi:hypothetical protein [Blastomonas sp. CACIA14H2]|uniref:hypothetical protein n=1 Tax=Blastomonas sp. CACIA14H2 TaxID=1419876 RepID=UPI0026BD3904